MLLREVAEEEEFPFMFVRTLIAIALDVDYKTAFIRSFKFVITFAC